jgi:hypothetical protein
MPKDKLDLGNLSSYLLDTTLETKASTILDFIRGLGGNLSVTFEEGTSAAWLYDLLKPHVAHLIVCDPRKNALLKVGNKNDRIDPRKLTDLLRAKRYLDFAPRWTGADSANRDRRPISPILPEAKQ